jgi:hypothetical protein
MTAEWENRYDEPRIGHLPVCSVYTYAKKFAENPCRSLAFRGEILDYA